jgi:mono/diheme cytochrome c family protein
MKYYPALLMVLLFACKDKTKEKPETYIFPSENKVEKMTPQEESIARGKVVYNNFCVQCHMPKGQGVPNIYPPLANSNWLAEKRKASIQAVKYGLRGEITVNGKTYDNIMLPLGLSDKEVADVLNYVMNSWGNKQEKPVTEEEVAEVRE